MSELKLSEQIGKAIEMLDDLEQARVERETSRATLQLWKTVATEFAVLHPVEAAAIIEAICQEMHRERDQLNALPNASILADAFSAFKSEASTMGLRP